MLLLMAMGRGSSHILTGVTQGGFLLQRPPNTSQSHTRSCSPAFVPADASFLGQVWGQGSVVWVSCGMGVTWRCPSGKFSQLSS